MFTEKCLQLNLILKKNLPNFLNLLSALSYNYSLEHILNNISILTYNLCQCYVAVKLMHYLIKKKYSAT